MTVPKRSRAARSTHGVNAGPGIPSGPGQPPSDRLPVHPRPFGGETSETVHVLRELRAELADLAAWLRR